VAFVWQIRRSGRWLPIRGAHSAAYVPTPSDVGHRIRVLAIYTLGPATTADFSLPSAPVMPARGVHRPGFRR
jgi:hypothetical protein